MSLENSLNMACGQGEAGTETGVHRKDVGSSCRGHMDSWPWCLPPALGGMLTLAQTANMATFCAAFRKKIQTDLDEEQQELGTV